MTRTILLWCLLLLILVGCSDSDSPLAPTQEVNSAVEAVLFPIIELMSEGDDASVPSVQYQISADQTSAVVTYNNYLHTDTGLTVSGSLSLVRAISGTTVSLTVTDTVAITGGTVAVMVWDAVASGAYDADEDDFVGPPDQLTGTITADGNVYQFSKFQSLLPQDSDDEDGPTVEDPHFLVAASTGTVVFSDNGSEWGYPNVAQSIDTGVTADLQGVASDASGTSLAVGNAGTILRSTDGIVWSALTTDITGDLTAIAWSNGHWVTMVNASEVYHSPDGLTWSAATVTNPTPDIFYDVVGDGSGGFIAVGSTVTSMVSSDNGETWTLIEPFHNDINYYRGIAFDGNSTWVAVGDAGMIALSTDTGQTWAYATSTNLTNARLHGVAYGNGRFIAVGSDPVAVLHSDDGDTWSDDSSLVPAEFLTTGNPLIDLATDGTGRWSVLGSYGDHLLSTDNGVSWSVAALDLYGAYAICYRP